MREAEERRKDLERQHAETLRQLRLKQSEVQNPDAALSSASYGQPAGGGGGGGHGMGGGLGGAGPGSAGTVPMSGSLSGAAPAPAPAPADRGSAMETIEALQSKIRELEKKTELQNVRHEELLLEMASIKRSSGPAGAGAGPGAGAAGAGGAIGAPAGASGSGPPGASAAGSGCSSAGLSDPNKGLGLDYRSYLGDSASTCSSPATGFVPYGGSRQHVSHLPLGQSLAHQGLAHHGQGQHGHLQGQHQGQHQGHHHGHHGSGMYTRPTDLTTRPHSPPSASANATSSTGAKAPASSVEIDRIMAKIEQDNRILAELDKTRSTIGTAVDSTRHQTISDALGLHSHPTVSTLPLTGLSSGLGTTLPLGMAQPSSLVQPMGSYLPGLGLGRALPGLGGAGATHQARMMPQIPGIPSIVTTQYDVDRGIIPGLDAQHLLGGGSAQGKVDMLDIPGKGRCYVYIARYSYDPFQQSPNDNPEAELTVNAGEYLLVWGTMDEDGFFDGELLDGRRGLVPSNFVQKLVGDDLLEFHQSVVLGLRDCDDCASTTLPQDLDFSMGHEYFDESMYGKRDYTYMDFDEMMDDEDEDPMGEGPVPAPKQLTLERQLNKSVLIGWNHPDNCPPGAIDSYLLYVDGVLKATVKATERTRALVEGVDSNRPHRISVRSITPNRRTSRDAACTMVIGKDLPLGPTRVKASHVTSTSAVISWLPANSNHQHVVCVNNVELRTVKPGVYRHTITGLAPDTVYRVTVRAKNIRAPHFDEKHNLPMERYSCHIDFVTLPKGCKGLPDPPAEIQVEPGPQDGTLLVTWLPVTANVTASSTNVTGYAVYADGKKVTDVDSPTGDHALIDIGKLLGLNPRQVTVRTKSRDAQSADSAPTPIPTSILRGKGHGHKERMGPGQGQGQGPMGRYGHGPQQQQHGRHGVRGARGTRVDQHGQMVIETEENLSDKEVYPGNSMSIPSIGYHSSLAPIAEITKDSASEAYSEEDYMGRRVHPGHPGHQGHYDQRPAPRSHAERGRPPLLPHERGRPVEQYDQYGRLIRTGGGQGYRQGGPMQQGAQGPQGAQGHQGAAAQRQQQNRVRWFVGLYDYDPSTMSPNPDGCVEELSFREGERIKVFGDRDADGFYWGEVRGRKGFIPENTVAEVTSPDAGMGGQGDPYYQRGDRVGDTYAASPVKKMVALYDYDPQELSPNVDADQVELTFRTGDIIYVYGEMDDDGFYMGELNGVRGLVPSNFLTPLKKHQEGDFRNGGPGPGPGRGGPMGPGMRPEGRHGPGPGARGPPPPPRDRRQDGNFPQPSQLGYHQQGPGGPPGGPRGRGGPPGRGGRGRGHPGGHPGGYMDGGGPGDYNQQGGPPAPGQGMQQQQHQQQQAQQQQQQQRQQQQQMKGVPKVVPDFVIPNNKESPTANTTSAFPPAPNLMQKLGDLTAGLTGGDNPADNLLSKGKELIFMKFGLGGK